MTLGLSDEHVELHRVAERWLLARGAATAARATIEQPSNTLPVFWDELLTLDWHRLELPEAAVVLEEAGRALAPGPLLPTMVAHRLASRSGVSLPDGPAAIALDTSGVVFRTGGPGGLRADGSADVVLGARGTLVLGGVDPDGDEMWAVVEDADEGVRVDVRPGLDLTRAVAAVHLDGVRVTGDQLLKGVNDDDVSDTVAVLASAEAAGVARWCVTTAADHARTREQFGRPIGQFQAVKHRCADMLVAAELARAAAWDAAHAQAEDEPGATLAVAAATAIALDAAVECAKGCIQVLGGLGYTWEHDAHLYLRRAVATRQMLGGARRWRRRAAAHALAGERRSLAVGLPADADERRVEVRALVAEIDNCEPVEVRRRLAETGYLVPEWPRPWGRGASAVEQVVIDEELRQAGIRRPDLLVGMWVVPTLITHGTPQQQERWIGPTLLGEAAWCQLFSEPGAGSDLASLSTKASSVEGGWRLTGQKVWTSLAEVADWGMCLARSDATAARHLGLTCFIVDMRAPGVDVRPLRELTGRATFNEVFLSDVFVPDDCVVGQIDDGWRVGRTTLGNERITMGRGSSLGKGLEGLLRIVAQLDLTADSLVLDQVGALVAEAHGLAILGHRAAVRALAGAAPGPEASIRKLLSAEHDQRVEELGLDLVGSEGIANDGRAKGWIDGVLLTRCLTIAGGTSEIQRNVLAERLLGLPRDP
ncbi:MAG: acyl-CoA dehydrogenase [Acidimicrobiales bacterium]|jgi:alkylation response protein AidB-like acyl-CoA dehydrogenase|nr:acyl-CoA dehydrogenase [Acidimicrobiales bacterium]